MISDLLLPWYDAHKRSLPWRDIHDPYATWVSETMLQQTRVETVLGYYARFMEAFPTLADLAAAPDEAVMKRWEGLGYYRRARNLHKGAQQVMADFGGVIPDDPRALKCISGIGEYTAGAIASIAYGRRAAAVDGNVIRVVSRVTGLREDVGIPSVRRELAQRAYDLVPEDRPGDFNQAVMDLGATICTPGTPSCELCPLQARCNAFAEGDAEELPVLPQKTPPREDPLDVLLIYHGDRVLMRRRTETLLNGLWVFPMAEKHNSVRQLTAWIKKHLRLSARQLSPCGEAKHIFTHRVWQMKLYETTVTEPDAPAGYRFVSLSEMEQLSVPTAVRKAKAVAAAHCRQEASTEA